MNRLSHRLIAIFTAAMILPLAATVWITTSLFDESLRLQPQPTSELDEVSKSLEKTGRVVYQRTREQLAHRAKDGDSPNQVYRLEDKQNWPDRIRDFYANGEKEHFELSEADGSALVLMRRSRDGVHLYSQDLGIPLRVLSDQYNRARQVVNRARGRDLRKGFSYSFGLLVAGIWLSTLVALIYLARRVSRPIQELTAGLRRLADGDLSARLEVRGTHEISTAALAFNYSAEQLQQSRDRLVHLTRLASWQTLARKMAHEVKNSLTPIRLTMEEVLARKGGRDARFIDQAAQIVVDEVGTLERRVRAFSEFASEPPVTLTNVELNAIVEERIAFLRHAHPESQYSVELEPDVMAQADADLLKSILTNLLENAAEAAGPGGVVLARTRNLEHGQIGVEVHDSGPGLSRLAKESLFEPTISFKKFGMGLGLSIARRSAVLFGGDIELVPGELGGAAFRVLVPNATAARRLAT